MPSGLSFVDLRLGEGAVAEPGDRCAVHYTGWLRRGEETFDSSRGRGEPFLFRLKKGDVIEGWLEGISGMHLGGVRRIVVPASLAYGDEGREGVIPPGAELTFEIELLDVVKNQPEVRLLVAPQTRVRWSGSVIELYVPGGPRTVETTDVEVLQVLHQFSTPTRRGDALAQFPDLPPESVEAVLDELEAADLLITLPSQAAVPLNETRASSITQASPTAGHVCVLFVVPPNLNDYGQLDVPCAFLFLASLAEQKGYATDFVIACSSAKTRPEAPRAFVGPSRERLPAILFLESFTQEVLTRIAAIQERGEQPILTLSCFSSSLYVSCMILGALARDRFPDLPILTGGSHPTIDPESMNVVVGSQLAVLQGESKWRPVAGEFFQALDEATARLTESKDFVFDYVFEGRADHSFLPVVAEIARTGARPDRPSIVRSAPMSDEEIGAFHYDPKILSRLAVEQASLASGPTRPFSLCFSFGCPYTCAFCINSKTREHWQGMNPEQAIADMEFLHRSCNINRFWLRDANFAARKSWRQAFFAALNAKTWIKDIHIDTETSVMNWELDDPCLLDGLSMTMQIGLESCSPEMLVRMDKTKKPEKYLQRLKDLIETLAPRVDQLHLMMIFGFPGESRETLKQSLTWLLDDCRVLSYRNVEICPQLYLPLIGTRAFEQTEDFGRKFGYRPNIGEWWNRDASDRFEGFRPSRALAVDTCVRLIDVLANYFRGETDNSSDPESAFSKRPTVCGTVTRSKLEQHQLRSEIWRILDQQEATGHT